MPNFAISCCGCAIAPLLSICSPIADLAQRIANIVSSLFTALAEFVKAWFCCPSPPIQPPLPTAVTVTPAAIIPSPAVPLSLAAPPIPIPEPTPLELGKAFLHARILNQQVAPDDLMACMQDLEIARKFLAVLVVHDLVMDPDTVAEPLPPFVDSRISDTATTFISQILSLREKFAALSTLDRIEVVRVFANNPDEEAEAAQNLPPLDTLFEGLSAAERRDIIEKFIRRYLIDDSNGCGPNVVLDRAVTL
ncbi:MAG TPA: hypothetical protein VIJ46_02910, partial [Rhabdochlamydiaceae bacterium]